MFAALRREGTGGRREKNMGWSGSSGSPPFKIDVEETQPANVGLTRRLYHTHVTLSGEQWDVYYAEMPDLSKTRCCLIRSQFKLYSLRFRLPASCLSVRGEISSPGELERDVIFTSSSFASCGRLWKRCRGPLLRGTADGAQ
ncbi:hypothetical protein AOLI_G00313680 [Acnodon oligacanthus]